MLKALALLSACILSPAANAEDFPQAEISNGAIQMMLYLPDAERGYYRGTRFDWSGQIYSLRYKDHDYFGQWFERYDPKLHDAIMGPVEEFRTGDAGLGYSEAKAGGTFIRIGVGVVRKPQERAYQAFRTYEIVNPGKWVTRPERDRITFIHELADDTGYRYEYRKTIRLTGSRPRMTIEHVLKNKGRKAIETAVYDHNFFVIDNQPAGPDFTVKFAFPLEAASKIAPLAEVRGDQLAYLKELEPRQSVFTELKGFGPSAKDYDIRIENRKVNAGVRITGDKPLQKVVFWSIRKTLCPEPYIQMRVEPGREAKWKLTYDFYTGTAE